MDHQALSLLSHNLTRRSPGAQRPSAPSHSHAERQTSAHQEKSSICQKLTIGSTKLNKGIARMYMIIQPARLPEGSRQRTPRKLERSHLLTNVLELAMKDVDDHLTSVDSSQHD